MLESLLKSDLYAKNSLISNNGTCYVAIEWAVVGDRIFIANLWKMLQSFALSVFLGLETPVIDFTNALDASEIDYARIQEMMTSRIAESAKFS